MLRSDNDWQFIKGGGAWAVWKNGNLIGELYRSKVDGWFWLSRLPGGRKSCMGSSFVKAKRAIKDEI